MNWAQFHKTAPARHGLWVMPLAVLLMVVMSLASCTTHDGYLHYQSLRVSGWEYRDSAAFVVDSLPTSGTRHLTIALRKSSAHVYPYTSLAIAVHQTWKLGDSTVLNRTDTLDCTFHHPDGMVRTKGVSRLRCHWIENGVRDGLVFWTKYLNIMPLLDGQIDQSFRSRIVSR